MNNSILKINLVIKVVPISSVYHELSEYQHDKCTGAYNSASRMNPNSMQRLPFAQYVFC